MDIEKIKVAAKAAYPELWPEDANDFPIPGAAGRAVMARHRTEVVDRITKALQAAEEFGAAPDEGEFEVVPLGDFAISLPEDAAMVQQVLTTVTYIDNEGKTAYVVRTKGEGLLTSWLGMSILTQNYLLNLPSMPDGQVDEG